MAAPIGYGLASDVCTHHIGARDANAPQLMIAHNGFNVPATGRNFWGVSGISGRCS